MILKQQLRNLLKSRDMTAAQLARKTGLSRQTISDWISGSPPRDIRQVKKVANELGVSVDNLCFGDQVKEKSIHEYEDEINAGIFEVVLRRVKR